MSAHQWSTTPLENQTADARAQWQEGQAASSLNNSARGMMASAALWRDDHLGTLVATLGANNVFSVTTNEGLIDPQSIVGGGTAKISKPFVIRAVLPAMTIPVATTAPTIVIDGAAAVPLVRRDGSALEDGDLTGIPVEILGDTVTSGAYTRARILNLLPSDVKALAPTQTAFPIGGLLSFSGSNTPTGFLVANGAVLQRADYPALFAHVAASGAVTDDSLWVANFSLQGLYTYGNNSTTFRIPALGGVFLRSLDIGRGLDPSRAIGTSQADAFRSHPHALNGGGYPVSVYGTGPALPIKNDPGGDTSSGFHAVTIANAGDSETRPVNVAYPVLIRAY